SSSDPGGSLTAGTTMTALCTQIGPANPPPSLPGSSHEPGRVPNLLSGTEESGALPRPAARAGELLAGQRARCCRSLPQMILVSSGVCSAWVVPCAGERGRCGGAAGYLRRVAAETAR